MSRIIDISLGVGPEMLTWPGDPGMELKRVKHLDGARGSNVSELWMGSHTGTHVDPPVHFLPDGDGVDRIPLDVFYGPAVVADLRDADRIGARELDAVGLAEGTERLLCRTRNSELWRAARPSFPDDYVAVTEDGAEWLVAHGLRLVGVDFLSVEARNSETHPVHKTLLRGGIIIVEGLDLSEADPGEYLFACMPLKVIDGDGAPARAALIQP